MLSVLFVCSANQYRSPFAAAFFRRELESRDQLQDWTVESAGTWALPGYPAAVQAQQAAHAADLDLNGHVARQVSLELLSGFDLILAMESGQVEAMGVEFPILAHRIRLLAEVATGMPYDIPDPFAIGEESSNVAVELGNLVHQGFDHIVTLASVLHENPTKE